MPPRKEKKRTTPLERRRKKEEISHHTLVILVSYTLGNKEEIRKKKLSWQPRRGLVILLPNRQKIAFVEKMIHSDQDESLTLINNLKVGKRNDYSGNVGKNFPSI